LIYFEKILAVNANAILIVDYNLNVLFVLTILFSVFVKM